MSDRGLVGEFACQEVRLAILVLGFRPASGFRASCVQKKAWADIVIVVENGADENCTTSWGEGVFYLGCYENKGVSAAYNLAAKLALSKQCTHLLVLDQDSDIQQETVYGLRKYVEVYSAAALIAPPYQSPSKGGYIGRWPVPRWGRWGFALLKSTTITEPTDILLAISSGSVVNLAVLNALGGFREELFIDLVDTEYCLRARSHGYDVLGVPVVPLNHEIGRPTKASLFGCDVFPTNHEVARHYTLARNRIVLLKSYLFPFPGWVIYEFAAAIKLVVKVGLFERNRVSKLWAMCRGSWRGLVMVIKR